jgi:nucleosome assembly protein 1-like 1
VCPSQIADAIKGKLIPQAVLWFTGEALDYEEDGGSEEDDDEEAALREMYAGQLGEDDDEEVGFSFF